MPPTTPQDHQRSAAETAGTPFVFEHNGETFTLPPSSAIKAGMLRRYRRQGDLDMSFSILEEIATPEALAALDDLGILDFNDVMARWNTHIGVTPGKS